MARLTREEMWERMLTGSYPRLHWMRRIWGVLPSPPRCKLCNAPFRGLGGVLMRAIAYGPSPLNAVFAIGAYGRSARNPAAPRSRSPSCSPASVA